LDSGLHYQLRISKDRLCRLYALWKKSVHTLDIATTDEELRAWGRSADELLNANIAEVTAGWGDNPKDDDDDDGDGVDQNLDEEDDMYIGLIVLVERPQRRLRMFAREVADRAQDRQSMNVRGGFPVPLLARLRVLPGVYDR
jgi:hypothetical protein